MGLSIVVFFIVLAIAAPELAPYDPNQTALVLRLQPPSVHHLLGNDELGRDILSRVIWGARTSMLIALGAVGLALACAIPAGLAAGYFRGRVDFLITSACDVLMAFPGLLLALAIVATFGFGTGKLTLALGVYSIPTLARLIRASTLAQANLEYVQAARALGQTHFAIMYRHVFPNILGPLTVEVTLRVGTVVLTAATLSFLGMGVQPPDPEWGAMIASSSDYLQIAPHATIFPGIALMLMVIGYSLTGDGLRDVLDPKTKSRM